MYMKREQQFIYQERLNNNWNVYETNNHYKKSKPPFKSMFEVSCLCVFGNVFSPKRWRNNSPQ